MYPVPFSVVATVQRRACVSNAFKSYDMEDCIIDSIVRCLVIGSRTVLDRKMTLHMEVCIQLNLDIPNGKILSLIVDNIF